MTLAEQLKSVIGQGMVWENEPMKNHTTFHIGGPADIFACPETEEGLIRGLGWCREAQVPFYIIGFGSNLLVGDRGFRGVIFKICRNLDALEIQESDKEADEVWLRAGAGVMLAKLAKDISFRGYTGFEFATGIPGTLGGAVTMNAGAYGGEMKEVLTEVSVMDEEGEIVTLPADNLELGYRISIINTAGYIVLEAKLQLKEGNPEVIRETMKDLTIRRTTKQPLEYPSAGSTFKRPEGYFAGKLIMDSGLAGYQVGGAQVSEKHCGFVINAGGATARDVRTLMDNVRDIVYKKYGVTLEPEVKFLGDFEA